MDRIPILSMGKFLLATIQVDMHDRLAVTLQEDLTNRIVETGATGVLIDISGVEMVDSFMGRMLANIASMARVLDAATLIVGMRIRNRVDAQTYRGWMKIALAAMAVILIARFALS